MEVVRAIILNISKIFEDQKIVYAFSDKKGYLSFVSPSVIFKKKNCSVNYMQLVEIEYFENPKGNLQKLKSVTPLVNTSAIYFDIYKMNIALLWCEVLNILLKREQRNDHLFDFLVDSINYLNVAERDLANFNLYFFYRLATLIGFRINVDTFQSGYVFNINEGIFSSPDSNLSRISGPNTAKIVYELCTCEVKDLKNITLNRNSRRILLDIIFCYFSIHLNVDFNIKTINIIREIFDE